MFGVFFRANFGATNAYSTCLLNYRSVIRSSALPNSIVLYTSKSLIILASKRNLSMGIETRISLLSMHRDDRSWSKRSTAFMKRLYTVYHYKGGYFKHCCMHRFRSHSSSDLGQSVHTLNRGVTRCHNRR